MLDQGKRIINARSGKCRPARWIADCSLDGAAKESMRTDCVMKPLTAEEEASMAMFHAFGNLWGVDVPAAAPGTPPLKGKRRGRFFAVDLEEFLGREGAAYERALVKQSNA